MLFLLYSQLLAVVSVVRTKAIAGQELTGKKG